MKLEQVLWGLRQWPRYTGLLGLIGAGLLLTAGFAYQQKIKPIQRDLAKREQSVAEETHRLAKPASRKASSIAVLIPLRPAASFTHFLRELALLAQQNKIAVQQTDYKSTPEGDAHLLRYGMQFPALGTYNDLRHFIASLEKIPGVRIEAFSVSRYQIADEQLMAQMQLSYLTETP